MNPDNNGSKSPLMPVPAKPDATPAEPAAPAAAPTPPVTPPAATPAPAATPPAEGQPPAAPAEPAKPAEPAPAAVTPPAEPRESAQQRRARELREEIAGKQKLADKLDPPATIAAPQPTPPAPTAPVQPQAPVAATIEPDYFDSDGDIDPAKHADWSRRVARAEAEAIVNERERKTQEAAATRAVYAQVENYVTSVESDSTYLTTSVPELTPDNPAYDSELDDHIERAYKQATTAVDANGNEVVVRTDISLKDFAMREVDMVRKRAEAARASIPNKEAGQTVDTAVAPTGGTAPIEPDISSLPLKERHAAREKKLGIYKPSKP